MKINYKNLTSRNSLIALCATGVALILIGGGYILWHQQNEIQGLAQEAAVAGTGYSSLVAEWTPIVPQLNCNWKDSSQDDSGSGTLLMSSSGTFYILTNAHVVTDDNGHLALSCDILFPDTATTTYTVARKNITIDPDGVDAALLQIPEGPYPEGLVYTGTKKMCTSPLPIGDELLVFGYPGIGSSDGITVTEGTVAGDDGDLYITSAKVDNGTSGGATVDVKEDCYAGIPSLVSVGKMESLADILKWGAMFANDPGKLSGARL